MGSRTLLTQKNPLAPCAKGTKRACDDMDQGAATIRYYQRYYQTLLNALGTAPRSKYDSIVRAWQSRLHAHVTPARWWCRSMPGSLAMLASVSMWVLSNAKLDMFVCC
jgi:hypothetical protein